MKLRELPGALILGLLASLLAHTASYGAAHATGGVYHEALLFLAFAGGGGFGLLLGLVAWFKARRLAEGSVLASWLSPLLPSPATVFAVATGSFFAIEAAEGNHAQAPAVVLLLALAVSSFALCKLAKLVVRAIAHVVFALVSQPFANRRPAYLNRFAPVPRAIQATYTYRRFARPPPRSMLAHP